MSYDQSDSRRDDQYNSRGTDDSSPSRNTDVQLQKQPEDNSTSYSHNFDSRVNEEARKDPEPSEPPSGYSGEDSSMNTGPIRYESYVPGPSGNEPENDLNSRDSDLYEDHDEGAGRGAEAQRYDAGSSNMGSHDDFSTGDIGQPISNGYDSRTASWARENSVSDDSQSASRGYAGDSSSSSAVDTSAVGASRNDEDDVGREDRSVGTDSKDPGVRPAGDDTRDRDDVGGRDESARSATASTFEEATTGNRSTDNNGSAGDNTSSTNAPTTSDALKADNNAYKSSEITAAQPRSSYQSADEGTDDNYGRSPYDATNVDHESQTTSSDGQTSIAQRGSSAPDEDRRGQDAITDTSRASREDDDDIGATTFGDQSGPNEDQTSGESLQRGRDMTPDTSDQSRSFTTNYGKSPYDAANVGRDSRTTSSDGRPSPIQRDSSALHNDQQVGDAATSKTSKADLDDNAVSSFDDQTSPGSSIRRTRDDAGDRGGYDQSQEGVDTPEAPSGHGADKSGSIEDSGLGTDAPVLNNDTDDRNRSREGGSAPIRHDANVRRDSHTTSDTQSSPSEQTSYMPNDQEQGEVTISAPRADVDNDGSLSFDGQPSFGGYRSSDDGQRYRDTADTIGKGLGSRDDNSNRGGLPHEGSYRGSSQGQDSSSNINAPTEDVNNSNLDKQNEDKQTGSDMASDTTGQGAGSERENNSTMSDRATSGADQPPQTIGYSGEQEDNKPYGDDGTSVDTGYDHSGYGGYAASTGYHAGGKPGLKDKLRGNAEVLVGRAAKKPELVERGLERKAGKVV